MSEVNIAQFGSRGLAFCVPDDEVDNLPEHIETLLACSHAVQQLLAQEIKHTDDIQHLIANAQLGATFITAMALELSAISRDADRS